jgi:hypothetical protein
MCSPREKGLVSVVPLYGSSIADNGWRSLTWVKWCNFLLQAVLIFAHARKNPPAATGALAKSGRSGNATVSGDNITIIEEKSKAVAID